MWQTWCLSPLPLQSAHCRIEYILFTTDSDHRFRWLQAVRNERLLSVVPLSLPCHLRLFYASSRACRGRLLWRPLYITYSCLHRLKTNKQTKQAGLLPCCALHTLLLDTTPLVQLATWYSSDELAIRYQRAKTSHWKLAVGQYRQDGANCSASDNMTADRTPPYSCSNGTILHSG
jgi:hypothetical protein